jgi:hypothetical protein
LIVDEMHSAWVMQGLGAALFVVFGWLLYAAHHDKRNKIDLTYLLVDPTLGKVTLAKFGGLLALFSSTYVFIYLALSQHFDATYASAYMLTWGAVKVAADFRPNAGKDGS